MPRETSTLADIRNRFLTWCSIGDRRILTVSNRMVQILEGEIFDDPNSTQVNILYLDNDQTDRVWIGSISKNQ